MATNNNEPINHNRRQARRPARSGKKIAQQTTAKSRAATLPAAITINAHQTVADDSSQMGHTPWPV
ncbi:hypothetical protein [Shewanella sp.]|uniref:hypothetical protein n=1 Tax=Shewanella sp. TaxID=50422 RepID=UPI003F3DC161